jgi:ankyrin repeat protein
VRAALAAFFAQPRALATANQVRQYALRYVERYWAADECRSLTALHHASRHGLTRTVAALLDGEMGVAAAGAPFGDVNVATQVGGTPIILAAAGGHVETVDLLMQRGADPYLCNWYGNALHCAVEAGHAAAARALIERWGMDVQRDGFAMRYLLCAMDRDSVEAFETLVDLGVGFRPDADGGDTATAKTLFKLACRRRCPKIVDLLIRRGWLDIHWRFGKGQTVLHRAARERCLAIIERLVEAGADLSALDDNGLSAWKAIEREYLSRSLKFAPNLGLQTELEM